MSSLLLWIARFRARSTFPVVTLASMMLPLSFHLLLQWLLYVCGFTALTADEFGRILLAAQWAQDPKLIWNGPWLPFHMYLFGGLFRLHWDLLHIPRVITAITGLVSLVFIYLLARTVFVRHRIAWLSMLLLSVSPAHIWLSSTPLTEIYHTTLILACMSAFVHAIHECRYRYLYISATTLALATGFRFEAWMVALVYSLLNVVLILWQRWHRVSPIFPPLTLVVAAGIPWIFPCAWLLGSALTTGELLAFLHTIQDYKRTWYGNEQSWANYLAPLVRIDPFAILLIPSLVVCLIRYRQLTVLWYCSMGIVPSILFLGLHGGQLEPEGNYIRYLAPFVFVLYPIIAVGLDKLISVSIASPRHQNLAIGLLCSIIVVLQGVNTLQFTNDPAGAGLAVGQHIRALRGQHHNLQQQSVLIELTYWQYMAIHIGANDLTSIVYDRPLDPVHRRSQSVLLAPPQALWACLETYNVGYLAIKSPELRHTIEHELRVKPIETINDYHFYRVPGVSKQELRDGTLPCPAVLEASS